MFNKHLLSLKQYVIDLTDDQLNYLLSSLLIGVFIMSMHSSLKGAAKIKTKRNVLKRFERVDSLKKDGRWSEGDRAYGLPKTKPNE